MVSKSVILGALGAAVLFFRPKAASAAVVATPAPKPIEGSSNLDDIFKSAGAKYGVDWKLIKAIGTVESSLNPNAVNPYDPSVGIMQVLCSGGASGAYCTNNFPAVAGWKGMTWSKLKNPTTNINVGAQIIAWNIKTYGFVKGIAVYNNWSAREQKPPFTNQAYVDKVLTVYNKLKG